MNFGLKSYPKDLFLVGSNSLYLNVKLYSKKGVATCCISFSSGLPGREGLTGYNTDKQLKNMLNFFFTYKCPVVSDGKISPHCIYCQHLRIDRIRPVITYRLLEISFII